MGDQRRLLLLSLPFQIQVLCLILAVGEFVHKVFVVVEERRNTVLVAISAITDQLLLHHLLQINNALITAFKHIRPGQNLLNDAGNFTVNRWTRRRRARDVVGLEF